MEVKKDCSSCGGALEFNPAGQNLSCTKCGVEVAIDHDRNHDKHQFDMTQVLVTPPVQTVITSMHCKNCGAVFTDSKHKMVTKCDYCDSNLVADTTSRGGIQPDGVIPFAFGKEEAKKMFYTNVKKKWFLPNKFKKTPPDSSLESVYIPAFNFNCKTVNTYAGQLIDVDRDSDGDQHYHYKKISGTKTLDHNNIMVESSEHITQATFTDIAPFHMGDCKKFKGEYLLGYSVEYYNRQLDEMRMIVGQTLKSSIKTAILNGYRYDKVNYLNIDTKYTYADYAHIILPTYRVKYNYKNKDYITFLNGQTGKVGGNVPRSIWKIAFLIGGILAVVIGLALIAIYNGT